LLTIRDEPVAPLIYALSDCPGARWTWEEVPSRDIALFASRGVRLFQADVWFEQMIGEDDVLDVSIARRQIAGVLAACPEAAVMLRLHVNAPPWWCARYRDECVRYADTEPEEPEPWGLIRPLKEDNVRPWRASFSSRLWREWAGGHLARFCRDLAATPEGDALFSLQIANGVYGEWHQFAFMYHDPDTGPAAVREFRRWMREKAGTEEGLAARWHRPGVVWDDVRPPTSAEREAEGVGLLRDPRRQRDVIDYFEFLHVEMVESLLGLCAVVRRSWPRPIVTAAFHGYFYNQFNRHAAGSHLAMERALASPDLDCFCAPQSYEAASRAMGGSGMSRGVLGAVVRAGKLWLDEMDQATAVCGSPWEPDFESTPADDVAILRRNVLQPVTRGGGMWWYDFGPTAGTPAFAGAGTIGWWDDPLLIGECGRLHALVRERLRRPSGRGADVLVVHDPMSFAHVASRRHAKEAFEFGGQPPTHADPLTPRNVDGLAEALHRSGMIHEDALLGELSRIDLAPYRLVIFATTPVLDDAASAVIAEVAKGRHVVVVGQWGWSDGASADPGLSARRSPVRIERIQTVETRSDVRVGEVVEEQQLPRAVTLPVYDVGGGAEVVGRWADGSASAVRIAQSEDTWWAFAVCPVSSALWREVGRAAGCRIVSESDDALMHGCGLFVVHTATGGARRFNLPGGAEIACELRARSSTVFDAESGKVLLA
jgi:hypothetical protein